MKKKTPKVILYAFLLLGFGWVMIFSAYFYEFTFAEGGSERTILQGLAIRTAVAILGFFVFSAIPLSFWKKNRISLVFICYAVLASVLIFGVTRFGARRWIDLPLLQVQPFEIFRIFFVLYLALYISKNRERIWKWRKIFILGFTTISFFVMVILQPNFSSAFLILFLTGTLLFLEKMPFRYIFISLIIGGIITSGAVITFPHIQKRVTQFVEKNKEPYQVIQSKIAISRGGLFGVGLGRSRIKYLYLPELSNDFIYALVGEETGFFGSALLLGIYFIFITHLFSSSYSLFDPFSQLLVKGVSLSFAFYTIIHIGVNLGFLPTTGLPLPFLSFGGSSLLANFSLIGLTYRAIVDDHPLPPQSVPMVIV